MSHLFKPFNHQINNHWINTKAFSDLKHTVNHIRLSVRMWLSLRRRWSLSASCSDRQREDVLRVNLMSTSPRLCMISLFGITLWRHHFQQHVKLLHSCIPVPSFVSVYNHWQTLSCLWWHWDSSSSHSRPHHSISKILPKSRTIPMSSHLHFMNVSCRKKPYSLANSIWNVALFVFNFLSTITGSQCVSLVLSGSNMDYSFGLSDHSGCSAVLLWMSALCGMLLRNAHERLSHYLKTFFLSKMFFLHSYSVMYTYPRIGIQTLRTHRLIYTCIHTWLHLSSLPHNLLHVELVV